MTVKTASPALVKTASPALAARFPDRIGLAWLAGLFTALALLLAPVANAAPGAASAALNLSKPAAPGLRPGSQVQEVGRKYRRWRRYRSWHRPHWRKRRYRARKYNWRRRHYYRHHYGYPYGYYYGRPRIRLRFRHW